MNYTPGWTTAARLQAETSTYPSQSLTATIITSSSSSSGTALELRAVIAAVWTALLVTTGATGNVWQPVATAVWRASNNSVGTGRISRQATRGLSPMTYDAAGRLLTPAGAARGHEDEWCRNVTGCA